MELTIPEKKERRSKLASTQGILQTIADGGQSGKIISAIVRISGCDRTHLIKTCEQLIDNGILVCKVDSNRTYFITDKGISFLKWLQEFRNTPEARYLRL